MEIIMQSTVLRFDTGMLVSLMQVLDSNQDGEYSDMKYHLEGGNVISVWIESGNAGRFIGRIAELINEAADVQSDRLAERLKVAG